uniref:Gag-pol polyprotein n=1 Tax=Solanum tuberosum TaxID=4113 RepID=M1DI19_SOLTU
MSKFVSEVSDMVVKECHTAILVHDMDISWLMVHAQKIEEENFKGRSREAKIARVDDGNYSHSRSGRRGRSRFRQKFSRQAMIFDMLPDVLLEPFSASTNVGDSVVAKRVYKRSLISLSHRVTLVDLIELEMIDYDVILGMDWLHSCYAAIDYRTRVVKFQFPNDPILD